VVKMPVTGVYDIENNKVSEIELSDAVFGAEINETAIYEVVKMQMASKRRGTASTKVRHEVRGENPGVRRGQAGPGLAPTDLPSGGAAGLSLDPTPGTTPTPFRRRSRNSPWFQP
jgi:large subunit ribosomal protein L4